VEVPMRTKNMLETVSKAGIMRVVEPRSYPLDKITAVHDQEYVTFIRDVNVTPIVDSEFAISRAASVAYPFTFPYSPTGISRHKSTSIVAQMGRYCFDLATPITKETYHAAYKSVEIALTGADILVDEKKDVVYGLCRPPGHHAMRAMCGGYSYFNNAAIAAAHLLSLKQLDGKGRVAILDVDFHHGNGTQDLFYDTDSVLYVSIHHSPDGAYPYFSGFDDECGTGKGDGFNVNLPLPSGTSEAEYTETLKKALDAIRKYGPDYLIVSLGFDTFCEDPISSFRLGEEYYGTMASLIAGLQVPSLIVTEGGYTVDKLGTLLLNFVKGWYKKEE